MPVGCKGLYEEVGMIPMKYGVAIPDLEGGLFLFGSKDDNKRQALELEKDLRVFSLTIVYPKGG